MAKIMAVDDEPDTIKLINKILKGAGYGFVGCLSGKECLEKLKKEKPDLVLLDIMMPEMDGWEVYERIKKINKKQRVAFLTVLRATDESRVGMAKMGVEDYITKPFEPNELLYGVKTILEKKP